MNVCFAAIFVLATATATALAHLEHFYVEAAEQVCGMFEENYYRNASDEARDFVKRCRLVAKEQVFLLSKSENIRRLNGRLSAIRISHLAVYDPDENKMIWENQGLDTGIRARMIEDLLVVHRVLPKSPGHRLGIRPGDVLVALNGEQLAGGWSAQTGAGSLRIRRGENLELTLNIQPEQISEDLSPRLSDLGRGRALLSIPSFLSQYFERDDWNAIAARLPGYKSVIIDLRENAGGSFPAMLRALSTFFCGGTTIGSIFRSPKAGLKDQVDLQDDLDAQSQLRQLAQAERIALTTYGDYGCYRRGVKIFVDNGTSSVAEIFAQAMIARPETHLYGQPTAGQVVMAQWFPLPALGSGGYSMSIPIAGYRSGDGTELEENGVHPQTYLFYDLPSSLSGRDSWIESVSF